MSDFTLEISDVTTTLEIETSTDDNTQTLEVTSSVVDSVEIQTGFSSVISYATETVGLSSYIANNIPIALSGMASIAGSGTSSPLNFYHVVIDGGSP
tara:strand:+ start:277 stop:567 length:291 start_codon:yes stop_codon:yes gene_type:complete